MAFRSTRRLAQLSRVSQYITKISSLTQGAEKSSPGFHAYRPSIRQTLHRNEYCRSLSTGFRSETEETLEPKGETLEPKGKALTSSAETISSAASADSSRPLETSVNVSADSSRP